MSGLLALLALMPILPAYIAPYLNDLFEVFRLVWEFVCIGYCFFLKL